MSEFQQPPNEEMLPAERRQRLVEWFEENQAGSSQELARMFRISVSTIRRDLDILASDGLVKRTHGGAVRVRKRATYEPSTDLSRRTAIEEKQAIAREALKLVEPDQSLLIDTGSVICHLLADEIAQLDIPLTIITNDLYAAKALTYRENIKLIVPGGTCRFGSYSLLGEPGASYLTDIRCDIFFKSAAAVDETCVSETLYDLVQLKRAMIGAAQSTVLLVDSSRFMARALHRTATIDKIDRIITDEGLQQEDLEKFPSPLPEFIIAKM